MSLRRLALALALLLGASLAPVGGAQAVPEDLGGEVEAYRAALVRLSEEPASEVARAEALDAHARVMPYAQDLAPDAHELLVGYAAALEEAREPADVRDLARAMASAVERDLAPAVARWQPLRTAVVLGEPVATREGVRVPILLLDPPSGGVGAFDVRLRVDPAVATLTAVGVEHGQGDTTLDASKGEARLASFDAQALLALESGARALTLGTLTLRAERPVEVGVDVVELVDRDGEPVPSVSPAGTVAPGEARSAFGSTAVRAAAFLGVAALAVGAVWASRKFLRV